MNVLFLAVGNQRRHAVVDQAAEVLAGGGRAVIVLSNLPVWDDEVVPKGAEVIEIVNPKRDHLPLRVERKIVLEIPRKVAKKTGRGPVRRPIKRALKAYERRVARPIHRRVLASYRTVWLDLLHQEIRDLVCSEEFDYVDLADSVSLVIASRIISELGVAPDAAPRITFGIDYI